MKKWLLLGLCVLGIQNLSAQEWDADLKKIQQRLDAVTSYAAEVRFNVDISFINMPTKKAAVEYKKEKGIAFNSEDFVLIPKKGLDFSLSELLKVPLFTVDRGWESLEGVDYKVVNIIPTTDKSDFSIAKLYLDTQNTRIKAAEISTKKEGVYWVNFSFEKAENVLPDQVTVEFEVEKFRLPINFMGKDTDIDRKQMRSDGPKRGAIYIDIDYTQLELAAVSGK